MAELIVIFILYVIAAAALSSESASIEFTAFVIFASIFTGSLRRYLLARKEAEHWRELQARMKGLELNQQQVLGRLHELEHPAAVAAREAKPAPPPAAEAVTRFMPETEKRPAAEPKPVPPAPAPIAPIAIPGEPAAPKAAPPPSIAEPFTPKPAAPAVTPPPVAPPPSVPSTPSVSAIPAAHPADVHPPTPATPPAAKPVKTCFALHASFQLLRNAVE